MADGIEIPIVADVAKFLAGTKDIESALDRVGDAFEEASDASDLRDAEGALDDVTRAAGDAERAVGDVGSDVDTRGISDAEGALQDVERAAKGAGDDLEHAGTEGKAAGERVEKSWREALDEVRTRAGTTGKKVGDDLDKGAKQAGEGFSDLKDEANQSAREAAASFSGDPVDALDFLQETAANALAGFGPLGAAAGLAIALGIGIGAQGLTDLSEQINATAEEAGQLALDWQNATPEERVASLRDRWDELATKIADSREWWEVWQADAITSIEQVAAAADTNTDIVARFYEAFNTTDPVARQQELGRALTELQDRLEDVNAELDGHGIQAVQTGDMLSEMAISTGQLTEAQLEQILALKDEQAALVGLRPEIEKAVAEQEKQNAITRALAEAAGLSVQGYEAERQAVADLEESQRSYQSALEAQAEPSAVYTGLLADQEQAARDMAEATAAATDDATDSWEDYYEGASVSTQQLIDEWNRQADEAAAFSENLRIIAAAGGDALANELRAKGPAVAGAVAAVIATSSPEQQQEAINAHGRATGGAVSASIGGGIEGNRSAVQGAIDNVIRSLGTPVVTGRLEVDQWQAQDAVNRTSRSLVPPVITVDVVPRRFEVFK